MSDIASRIEAAIASEMVAAMRPMDYLFSFAPHLAADRALVLPVGENDDEKSAVAIFADDLRRTGLPFSMTGDAAPEGPVDTPGCRLGWSDDAADAGHDEYGATWCLWSSDAVPTPTHDWLPELFIVPADSLAWNGIRSDGRMHLVYHEWAEAGPADVALFEDLAVLIRPRDVLLPLQRRAILLELQEAVWDGRVRLHTVAGLVDLVLAPEPVLTRLWSTLRRMATDPPQTDTMSAGRAALLLDDARLAWRYIERFTDPVTGLCAGTVQEGSFRHVNLEASLWDLASQVQGIIAAGSLGIILHDEARDRVQMVLRNVPSINLLGLNLPPAMFKTDRTAEIAVKGFDVCDTGRFLIALRSAVAAGLATEVDVGATLGKWDLDAMIRDGSAFNISGNQRIDVTYSHCTAYITHAFAELGLPLRSPYSQLGKKGGAEDLIRLLYSAAMIGSFGTEPLLLETIEQGASPEVAFLSAVLFDAQLSWYEDTGEMKSISEAPLNFEPWFIYQGLRVDRLGKDAWTIDAANAASRFKTPQFRQRAEVMSAKSAYLWAAVHPHPYCDKLVHLIRDKGRVDNLGFSVGVFSQTLEAMEDYSDLNTNGIILSAISTMLGASPPKL